MQSSGISQTIVTPSITVSTPSKVETPKTTPEVQVGSGSEPQVAQEPKRFPGVCAKFELGSVTSREVLNKDGLLKALGTEGPSTKAKAKTFFASGFNKIANLAGFSGVRKSDFVELTKAVKEYTKAKAEGAPSGVLKEKLELLQQKLESHQSRHPSKLKNVGEVTTMIKEEISKLAYLERMESIGKMDNPTEKANAFAKLLVDYAKFSSDPESHIEQSEQKTMLMKVTTRLQAAMKECGSEGIMPSVHKTLMTAIRNDIEDHATSSGEGTLLRGNGDVVLSKPHAVLTFNSSLEGIVRNAIGGVAGQDLEIDPTRVPEKDHDKIPGRVSQLKTAFGNMLDSVGVSGDDQIRRDGIKSLPQELCDQAKCLYDEVIKAGHSEKAAKTAVGSLIILKLVNPLLISPQGTEEVPVQIQDKPLAPKDVRSMILISKLVQNVANNTQPNDKYMETFREGISSRQEAWSDFVGGVVARGRDISTL
jgi:hypothetical protein